MTQIDVTPVDWSKPIEAVHTEAGTVVPVSVRKGPDHEGDYVIAPSVGYSFTNTFRSNGESWSGTPWRIRNRQEPQSTDPKLVEQMEALIRDLERGFAGWANDDGIAEHVAVQRAREIVQQLGGRKPKTDEEWAKHMVGMQPPVDGIDLALRCIRKGRELERENPS